jgi:hypothetical protein
LLFRDDNHGRHFRVAAGQRPFRAYPRAIIPGVDVSLGNVWSRPGRFGGDIVTRLMPGHKTVNVLYTLDGWKTVHSVSARRYHCWYCGGPESYAHWRFETELPEDAAHVNFAVRYEAADKVAWDDNFSAGFSLNL